MHKVALVYKYVLLGAICEKKLEKVGTEIFYINRGHLTLNCGVFLYRIVRKSFCHVATTAGSGKNL